MLREARRDLEVGSSGRAGEIQANARLFVDLYAA
jgi:hypothetical protein